MGWVWGLTGRSGTNRVITGEVLDGLGTIAEIQDLSGEPRRGPAQVVGPSGRSGTGWGTHGEFWEASGDHREGPEWVGGHSGRSGKGKGTLG